MDERINDKQQGSKNISTKGPNNKISGFMALWSVVNIQSCYSTKASIDIKVNEWVFLVLIKFKKKKRWQARFD